MLKKSFINSKQKMLSQFVLLMKEWQMKLFEYDVANDIFYLYDSSLEKCKIIEHYLSEIKQRTMIHACDQWKVIALLQQKTQGPIAVRARTYHRERERMIINIIDDNKENQMLFGYIKNVSKGMDMEEHLWLKTKRDQLTMLYHFDAGKEIINDYLIHKNPFASCGFMSVAIDHFEQTQKVYGASFGNHILLYFSSVLRQVFSAKDILVRRNEDHFLILLKDIGYTILTRKAQELIDTINAMEFAPKDFCFTCRIGVCFVPQDTNGIIFDQLLKNADWALEQAKRKGKNQYVFCDHLGRYEDNSTIVPNESQSLEQYLYQQDMITTTFQIFEKMNHFSVAMEKLLKLIGEKFQLDTIALLQTDLQKQSVDHRYHWSKKDEEPLFYPLQHFEKEQFSNFFHAYDENDILLINKESQVHFSKEEMELLLPPKISNVAYIAMYDEGKYIGTMSYALGENQACFSDRTLLQLSYITKIIAAHFAKQIVIEKSKGEESRYPYFDSLSGLLTFPTFREKVEKLLANNPGKRFLMVYTDIINFKYINQKYGYSVGDDILRQFVNHIIVNDENEDNLYFVRMVSDRFITIRTKEEDTQIEQKIDAINQCFMMEMERKYPGIKLQLRSGVYCFQNDGMDISFAIDACDYVRCQVDKGNLSSVKLYDEKMDQKRNFENAIMKGMDHAITMKEFKVYYQPRISFATGKVVAAEALVRWEKADGTVLTPDQFIPLYEANGRIIELDYYVFEEVVTFLAQLQRQNEKMVPISVNASILHANNTKSSHNYRRILDQYHVDPSWLEVELTETDTISSFENVKEMFKGLQKEHIKTALDDFGAGYSLLNVLEGIPVDCIKIDRMFVQNCESDEKVKKLLHMLVQMVKSMGYHVVCEGIEKKEQATIVQMSGCDEGQGYYFAKPMPQDIFKAYLKSNLE